MKVMGIDLGIHKVAVAVWEDGVLLGTDAYETVGLRHDELMNISDFVYCAVKDSEADHVFIEDTLVGNNIKYSIQLSEAKGAILSSLGLYCTEHYLGVYLVNNKTWKKDVLGNGNADKDKVRIWVDGQGSEYSLLCGDDQDRYDAACIGYYGTLIAERAGVLADV